MTLWSPDNIKDVAESVGIASLSDDVSEELARDVEFRIGQAIEESLKFMRHSKRTTLTTQDISQALRVLDVEPLYGYESTRPLRFGEASMGPGQPLYYVEDEEVDFEKLINAPLPKVPREISFTGEPLLALAPASLTSFSTLACPRRRPTRNSTKPYILRLETSRSAAKGPRSESSPCRRQWLRQCRRQTSGQTRHFQGTAALL